MSVCFQLVALQLSSQRNLKPGATVPDCGLTLRYVFIYTYNHDQIQCLFMLSKYIRWEIFLLLANALGWWRWRGHAFARRMHCSECNVGGLALRLARIVFSQFATRTHMLYGAGMNNLLKIMECLIGKKCLEAFIINEYECVRVNVRMVTYHTVAREMHAHMLIYAFY